MKIALFGASGNIGRRILAEALSRGHEVTAIVRDPSKLNVENTNLTLAKGDIMNPNSVSINSHGHDVVISAYGPGLENVNPLIDATKSLIEGVKNAGVKRLIAVGGAGSLEVAPGLELVDALTFPDFLKPIAIAHREALKLYLDEKELHWSNAHPAAYIEPGERTGKFRIGGKQLLSDDEGNSKISMEDYAIALIDEAENPKHIQKRFTVAY